MENSRNLLRLLVIVLWTGACTTIPEPSIKPPPPPPTPQEGDPCFRACKRLEQLECEEAKPEAGNDGVEGTEDDVPCLEWMCKADYLDYEAIAHANTCKEANGE